MILTGTTDRCGAFADPMKYTILGLVLVREAWSGFAYGSCRSWIAARAEFLWHVACPATVV